jgi:uncharacterized protein YneF (UPF0154 family)
MITSSHVFYIPIVLMVGLILGVVLGRRSLRVQMAEEERLKQRKIAREAQRASAASASPIVADAPGPTSSQGPPPTTNP